MTLRFRRRELPAIVLLCMALPGCISYGLDRLPPVEQLPPPPAPEQRVAATFTVKTFACEDYQFTPLDGQPWGWKSVDRDLALRLGATGWFRSVRSVGEGASADLQLDFVLTARGNDIAFAASAVTLFVLPTWRTTTLQMTVDARRADGTWRRYVLDDATRDIHWLPLILVMPVHPWGSAYSDVRTNMYRTLVERLHADGMLAPPASAP